MDDDAGTQPARESSEAQIVAVGAPLMDAPLVAAVGKRAVLVPMNEGPAARQEYLKAAEAGAPGELGLRGIAGMRTAALLFLAYNLASLLLDLITLQNIVRARASLAGVTVPVDPAGAEMAGATLVAFVALRLAATAAGAGALVSMNRLRKGSHWFGAEQARASKRAFSMAMASACMVLVATLIAYWGNQFYQAHIARYNPTELPAVLGTYYAVLLAWSLAALAATALSATAAVIMIRGLIDGEGRKAQFNFLFLSFTGACALVAGAALYPFAIGSLDSGSWSTQDSLGFSDSFLAARAGGTLAVAIADLCSVLALLSLRSMLNSAERGAKAKASVVIYDPRTGDPAARDAAYDPSPSGGGFVGRR